MSTLQDNDRQQSETFYINTISMYHDVKWGKRGLRTVASVSLHVGTGLLLSWHGVYIITYLFITFSIIYLVIKITLI